MSKDEISFKNRDRFIQMGIAISSLRKMRGMSQEQLAEKASISRSHLSAIEAPNMVRAFSMEAFFNIADALDVKPEELIQIASKSAILNSRTYISKGAAAMDQMQNRRIAAVKAADAINAIEGVPVSDYAKTLSACWAKGGITDQQMKAALLVFRRILGKTLRR